MYIRNFFENYNLDVYVIVMGLSWRNLEVVFVIILVDVDFFYSVIRDLSGIFEWYERKWSLGVSWMCLVVSNKKNYFVVIFKIMVYFFYKLRSWDVWGWRF